MPRTIGESRGCRRACQQCTPKSKLCRRKCPGYPVVKEYRQGIIMTGKGKPPGAKGGVRKPKVCFLYWHWYDIESDRLYQLRFATDGQKLGYDCFPGSGAQLLVQYLLTFRGNTGSLGSVVNSGVLFELQDCVNARIAPVSRSFANNNAPPGTAFSQAQSLINCAVNTANRGSLGFVFANPPVPAVLASLVPNQGYTLQPDYWLAPGSVAAPGGGQVPFNGFQDFGWIVFVRDPRNSRYYRCANNSKCNDPHYPKHPCEGDLHCDEEHNLLYEFLAGEFCRWYLLDTCTPLPWSADAANQGLHAAEFLCLDQNPCKKGCSCDCSSSSSSSSSGRCHSPCPQSHDDSDDE